MSRHNVMEQNQTCKRDNAKKKKTKNLIHNFGFFVILADTLTRPLIILPRRHRVELVS